MNTDLFNLDKLHEEERFTRDYSITLSLMSDSKPLKVSLYIINHIMKEYNVYHVDQRQLAKKLGCSKQTVSRAMNILKKDKYLNVDGNYVKLNYADYDKEAHQV